MSEKKVIVITGAGSGFGRLSALELARGGHKVYASMRDLANHSKDRANDLRTIAEKEGIDLHPLELDVRYESSCRSAADYVLAAAGRIDVVINNAAMMMAGLTEAFRPEQVAQIIDLNAISWLRVNRAFLPAMRRQNKGLLLYIGSGIVQIPDPFTGPYAASKAAGDVLAQIMGLENSRYNIETVICMPGAYTSGTDHFKHAVPAADPTVADQYEKLAGLAHELASKLDATMSRARASTRRKSPSGCARWSTCPTARDPTASKWIRSSGKQWSSPTRRMRCARSSLSASVSPIF